MDFEWDPREAERNLKCHAVSFTEAIAVFGDPLEVTISDPDRRMNLVRVPFSR